MSQANTTDITTYMQSVGNQANRHPVFVCRVFSRHRYSPLLVI